MMKYRRAYTGKLCLSRFELPVLTYRNVSRREWRMHATRRASLWRRLAGAFAVAFGLLTIASGGRVLFGGPDVLAEMGSVVPFVLWFNFLAGFAYVAAGGGLLTGRSWAFALSAGIFALTLAVSGAFAVHVARGGGYEMRTVLAMIFRAAAWLAITVVAWATTANSLGTPAKTEA